MQTQITPSPDLASGKWTTVDPIEACRLALHKKPFAARHPLAGHPLFTIDALIPVAEEAAKRRGDLYADVGDLTITDKWGTTPEPTMPIPKIIDRIETAGAWIVMKHVEVDPRYKAVLDDYADFVRGIAGPEGAKLLRNPEMLVFITSPNRITPFHFDAEVNFLVQLQGSKDLWVCDPSDRSITTEEEIERYYGVSITAGTYKPHAEERATKFSLGPGDAVHIPTHAGHWVKNHDNISVSLSLNMEFPNWMQADVHRANHYLRRLGLSPRPPGRSILVDKSKAAVIDAMRTAKRLVRR
ncbi:cupin-like domain-containing protein [Methylocapsa aurea]|uniref:cupin-like domain-containing protein n=1 Tax=Methylocapsa aurea TaxID=663610 RepID=UPI00068C9901|nr:cupin-like domain-containing protein [Methylocapsa aurea]